MGEENLILVDVGHYESEQFTIDLFYDLITNKFDNFSVYRTSINTNPVIYTNTLELLLNSTIKGIGLCRIPDVFCKDKIKTGELLALLPDHIMVPDRGVYAIYPDRRYLPMKVKLFIDAINSHLRSGAI